MYDLIPSSVFQGFPQIDWNFQSFQWFYELQKKITILQSFMNGFFDNKLNTNVYRIICKKKWHFSELKTIGVLWNRKYVKKEKVTVF